MAKIQIFPDAETLAKAAADLFVSTTQEAISAHGVCSVALSGGSTPQATYTLLASEPYRQQVDWPRLQIFWGDERCVPPNHPDSNYLHAYQALLSKVPVPEKNIHRVKGELEPEKAAEDYENELLTYFSSISGNDERERASFDLTLLGMGDDGHTASLFPGTSAINEDVRWVVAHYIDKLAAWRVTLTPAILNRAARVLFLVAGKAKSLSLEMVLYGSHQPERFPSQIIQPRDGQLIWYVDEDAATLF